MSDANKALIRCAWENNPAFSSQYGARERNGREEWPGCESEPSCGAGCVGGVVGGCCVLVLMCTGWLGGAFTKIGCPSPFKKPTRPQDANRDSTTSKPTTETTSTVSSA